MSGLMEESRRSTAAALHTFAVLALERAGAGLEDAHLVADGLLAADLRGVRTHGVLRLSIYVTSWGEVLEGGEPLIGGAAWTSHWRRRS